MRLYATITAAFAVVAIVGFSGAKAFADTTTNAGTVPAANKVTVQVGENLSGIAASNKTTYVRIYDANQQIQDPDLIYPAEVLTIPSNSEQLPSRQLPSTAVAQTYVAPVSAAPDADDQVTSTVETPAATPTPVVSSNPTVQAPAVSGGSIWDSIAQCESGGNWSINTGNGFYGGLQFTLSSWQAVGGTGYPNDASRSEQIMRAQILQSEQGWGAWPVCSVEVGL